VQLALEASELGPEDSENIPTEREAIETENVIHIQDEADDTSLDDNEALAIA
jgi:hypothetical protein